jgi:hypothetical protein
MSNPFNDPEWKAFVARWLNDVYPHLADSAIAVTISPDVNSELDVQQAVELGCIILMDKPLLVFTYGRTIPERLRRAADLVIEGAPGGPGVDEQVKGMMRRFGDG